MTRWRFVALLALASLGFFLCGALLADQIHDGEFPARTVLAAEVGGLLVSSVLLALAIRFARAVPPPGIVTGLVALAVLQGIVAVGTRVAVAIGFDRLTVVVMSCALLTAMFAAWILVLRRVPRSTGHDRGGPPVAAS